MVIFLLVEIPTLCLSGLDSFRKRPKKPKSVARNQELVPTIILRGIVTRADMTQEVEVEAAEATILA